VNREARRLAAARPDLVLANVPYVTIAAAHQAGIPVVAFSSLNWADMADHYLGHLPECTRVRAEIRASYEKAALFLRATPGQPMTLSNVRDIGPVARLGRNRYEEIRARIGAAPGERLGLIAFGGIEHNLPLDRWPRLDGWRWLSALQEVPSRPDMAIWTEAGVPFADLLPSVDLLVCKTGYGTFSEAGLAGIPVLYEARPDWPEAPPLEQWLARHTRCLPATTEQMLGPDFPMLLQRLFSLPIPPLAQPTGVAEGAEIIANHLPQVA